ncbi:MAG TPA: toll/interleukin-1 receptor domain-containing protein [Polyangiaceae bacterium]|jgi:hypothetical protein|nr:toll/interleukin-1 receptor domain-containing protein [Polyangiaceae bacterium]
MIRIFVSYARQDTPMVEPLVECLRRRGFEVTWDNDLPFGKRYREVLRAEIESADRVIVAWTRASVTSLWVQQEADLAFKERKLLPLRFETAEPPMPFGAIQSGDFTGWNRTPDAECFLRLISELDSPRPSLPPNQHVGSTRPVVGPARPGASGQHVPLILGSFAAVVIGVSILYRIIPSSTPVTGTRVVQTASQEAPAPTSTPRPVDVPVHYLPDPIASNNSASATVPAPIPSPAPHPGSLTPPRNCCHPTGGKLVCLKPRCTDCGWDECPK